MQQHNLQKKKQTDKQTNIKCRMVVNIFSEITMTGKKRKTNMGKQGKPQENRGKPRKTGETW